VIRYVLSFPPNANITQQQFQHFREILKEAADAKEYRDICLSNGVKITDMRGKPVAALIRRARARAR